MICSLYLSWNFNWFFKHSNICYLFQTFHCAAIVCWTRSLQIKLEAFINNSEFFSHYNFTRFLFLILIFFHCAAFVYWTRSLFKSNKFELFPHYNFTRFFFHFSHYCFLFFIQHYRIMPNFSLCSVCVLNSLPLLYFSSLALT